MIELDLFDERGELAGMGAEVVKCGGWVRVHAPKKVNGRVCLPPSKSVSNRLLVLEALSGGRVVPERLSKSRDTRVLRRVLAEALCERYLFVEDGGAPLRFLLAYLAVIGGEWVVDCGEALRRRPHLTLIKVLEELGGTFKPLGGDGLFPLRVCSRGIVRRKVFIREPVSSQFVSALMLVGWRVHGGLTVVVEGCPSVDYILLTERLLRVAGVDVLLRREGSCMEIYIPHVELASQSIPVSGDWTLLPYLVSMVGLCGGRVCVEGLLGWQSFENCLPVVERLARHVNVRCVQEHRGGDGGDWLSVIIEGCEPQEFASLLEVDLCMLPDASVALMPLLAYASAERVVLHLSANLQVKESDRLRALLRIGQFLRQHAVLRDDVLEISGERRVPPPVIGHEGDHRVAMLASVLAGLSGWAVVYEPWVVEKSTPEWWELLEDVGWKVEWGV